MNVRAKFRCIEKTNSTSTAGYGPPKPVDTSRIKLQAVHGQGNEEWSKWTPSGNLEMQITNPAALDAFEVGKDYYLDVTPVPAEG